MISSGSRNSARASISPRSIGRHDPVAAVALHQTLGLQPHQGGPHRRARPLEPAPPASARSAAHRGRCQATGSCPGAGCGSAASATCGLSLPDMHPGCHLDIVCIPVWYPNIASFGIPEESGMGQTLYEKVFNRHVVREVTPGQYQLLASLHLLNEVSSPQAFEALRERGLTRASPGPDLRQLAIIRSRPAAGLTLRRRNGGRAGAGDGPQHGGVRRQLFRPGPGRARHHPRGRAPSGG